MKKGSKLFLLSGSVSLLLGVERAGGAAAAGMVSRGTMCDT